MVGKLRLLAGIGLVATAGYLGSATGTTAYAAEMAGPNVIDIVATDYKFEMPDSVPEGPTLIHLTNKGNELHHVTLVKLEEEKTLADFTALPPGPMPSWVVFVGGPNTPPPHGGEDEIAIDLKRGNYIAICLIPSPDGMPHMAKGMSKVLKVTASDELRALPDSDLTLSLSEYQFGFATPPTAGKHAIRVVNDGVQPHEAVLMRLASGKTGEDVLKWVGSGYQGPPPAEPVAGVSPESPGHENIMMVDLTPGKYTLLCFIPDEKDGAPHAQHGMIHDFSVE